MTRNHSGKPWCRYADDGLVHCKTEEEAKSILEELRKRFEECGLMLHPDKTKIVYCKDDNRKGSYKEEKFKFLGYTFRSRVVENNKTKKTFIGFTPSVSMEALKDMRAKLRKWSIRNRTDLGLEEISKLYNPVIRGWWGYYAKFNPSGLYPFCRSFNKALVAWAIKKYKGLKMNKRRATKLLQKIAKENPQLFEHWNRGMIGSFV